jgi:hypothetical protein
VRPTIRKRRLLVQDGQVIGWLVKRNGRWRAYILTRLDFRVAFWVGEGRTREEAADAAVLLAEAHDVCYDEGAAESREKPTEETDAIRDLRA